MTRRRSVSIRLGAGIGALLGSLLIACTAPAEHHQITTTTRTTTTEVGR